jgi:hypothetical protein
LAPALLLAQLSRDSAYNLRGLGDFGVNRRVDEGNCGCAGLAAHDDHQNFNFLFRLRSPRNHCGKFIEYLDPALYLTAIFSVLPAFISNEGEFRLAVSTILKGSHIVHAVYGLMFYSILRRVNLVFPSGSEKHMEETIFSCRTISWYSPPFQKLLPIRRSHAAEKFSTHAKIHFAKRRSKTLRPPPLHHIFRICPRLPNQFEWGIKSSCDNHPLCLVNRVFCHL